MTPPLDVYGLSLIIVQDEKYTISWSVTWIGCIMYGQYITDTGPVSYQPKRHKKYCGVKLIGRLVVIAVLMRGVFPCPSSRWLTGCCVNLYTEQPVNHFGEGQVEGSVRSQSNVNSASVAVLVLHRQLLTWIAATEMLGWCLLPMAKLAVCQGCREWDPGWSADHQRQLKTVRYTNYMYCFILFWYLYKNPIKPI